ERHRAARRASSCEIGNARTDGSLFRTRVAPVSLRRQRRAREGRKARKRNETRGALRPRARRRRQWRKRPQRPTPPPTSDDPVALIDPLAGVDLRPFWEIIADPGVEKIVHAGEQDVEPVIRHLGREAHNVFDTQIACGFIGMAYPVALAKLVAELVGAKLGKGLTFPHWDQRPLSASELRYPGAAVRLR